jgi:anti-sigma factor RsiW
VANRSKFGELESFEQRPVACAVCETMLPEAVDGMLSEAEQSAFDRHVAGCVECARELAEAKRGAAWLSMLKSQAPEAPAGLLAKILAETTGVAQGAAQQVAAQQGASTVAAPVAEVPAWVLAARPAAEPQRGFAGRGLTGQGFAGQWAAFRAQCGELFLNQSTRVMFQPRFAMTAAMAFFSIALTLNLTGVRLRDLRASNFTPSALKRTVADVDASATRTFQNNRAVYQVESRLSELRSDGPDDASPAARR